jgi:hypothetical protein
MNLLYRIVHPSAIHQPSILFCTHLKGRILQVGAQVDGQVFKLRMEKDGFFKEHTFKT